MPCAELLSEREAEGSPRPRANSLRNRPLPTSFHSATFPNGEGIGLCVSFDFSVTANSNYQPQAADDRPYGVKTTDFAVYLALSGRELAFLHLQCKND